MIRIKYGRLILVAFLGGLVGGFMSTQFLSGKVASAQGEGIQFKQRQIYAKTIIAEEYFLHARNSTNALDSEIPVPRALLTTEPDGNPKLIMQDSSGNPRFSIILGDNDGTTLSILDMDGNKKVLLSEKSSFGESQLGPTLALSDDTKEKPGRSIRLCLKEKDEASISLFGIGGRQRAELAVDSNNTCLSLKDINGETRAELGNTELAFGKDGLMKKTSSGTLSVEQRPASSLVMYNENGKVLWSAP